MIKKVLFLCATYYSVCLLQSCLPFCNCDNVNDLPYYTVQSFETIISDNIINVSNDTLLIDLMANQLDFVSSNCTNNFFGVSTLMACSCPAPGWQGMKYKVVDYDIRVQENFSAANPAGSSIKDQSNFGNYSYMNGTAEFEEFPNLSEGVDLWYNGVVLQFLGEPDSLGMPFTFEIELILSNQEILTSVTEQVVFVN